VARTDYFTRAEFRAFAKDTDDPPRYADGDIDDAQDEVIDRLEEWARTSWARVDPDSDDGDGVAHAYRSETERVQADAVILLRRRPLVEVTSFTIVAAGGDVFDVDASSYLTDFRAAILRLVQPGDFSAYLSSQGEIVVPWPTSLPSEFEIVYTYGWGTTPRAVKVPAMMATRTRMAGVVDSKGKGARIPERTRTLTTSRTTLELQTGADTEDEVPWPWDQDASAQLRSYWAARRPRRIMSVVGGA
jgi:head-tail adaptor